MAQYDDLNARQIWAVGIVSAALTAVTILAIQVLYYALLSRHNDVKLAGSEYTVSNAYLAADAEQIRSYGRDAETGAVRIPIERAMALIAQRKAQASGGQESSGAREPIAVQKQADEPATEPVAEKPQPVASTESEPQTPAGRPAEEMKGQPDQQPAAPAERDEAPAEEKEEMPAEANKEAPADEKEEPADEKEEPADVEEVPAEQDETPAAEETEEAPAEEKEEPASEPSPEADEPVTGDDES